MKKILLFGGTFDPIHNAHLKLAEIAYKTIDANYCYFILAKNPRWKTPLSRPIDRLRMLKLALKDKKKFKISLIEYNSKEEVTYTYNTIVEMKKKVKGEYYYLIGADQLNQLDKWYKIDELAQMVNFVVFRRYGYSLSEENIKRYNCRIIEAKEMDVSSTHIRLLNRLDSPKPVLDYIAKHEMYYTSILKQYISQKRLNHSFSVANLAYDIALSNNKDALKAYHAGLIHDIAKGVTNEEAEALMIKHFPQYLNKIGKWGYHQFIGVIIAKEIFKINDSEILSAIEYHATGKAHMTPLAKIIYCADKLDPSRGWDSKKFIIACKKDYNRGFIEVLKDNIRYFKENNIDFSNELSDSCVEYYLKEEIKKEN